MPPLPNVEVADAIKHLDAAATKFNAAADALLDVARTANKESMAVYGVKLRAAGGDLVEVAMSAMHLPMREPDERAFLDWLETVAEKPLQAVASQPEPPAPAWSLAIIRAAVIAKGDREELGKQLRTSRLKTEAPDRPAGADP